MSPISEIINTCHGRNIRSSSERAPGPVSTPGFHIGCSFLLHQVCSILTLHSSPSQVLGSFLFNTNRDYDESGTAQMLRENPQKHPGLRELTVSVQCTRDTVEETRGRREGIRTGFPWEE